MLVSRVAPGRLGIAVAMLFVVSACDERCDESGAAACSAGWVDSLPKRGDLVSDPTILDVKAYADTDERVIGISASDPGGSGNLAGCQITANGVERVGTFSHALCYVRGPGPDAWQIGRSYVIDVLVSNGTGGFTMATVRVAVEQFGN
jgi:hypothetical protein